MYATTLQAKNFGFEVCSCPRTHALARTHGPYFNRKCHSEQRESAALRRAVRGISHNDFHSKQRKNGAPHRGIRGEAGVNQGASRGSESICACRNLSKTEIAQGESLHALTPFIIYRTRGVSKKEAFAKARFGSMASHTLEIYHASAVSPEQIEIVQA